MLIDREVGAGIALSLQGTPAARPLTHDLSMAVLRAFGARIERVIIADLKDDTYFWRLVLSGEHELQQKTLFELDVQPSDGMGLAARQGAPIGVRGEVWDQVQDVSEMLRKLQGEGTQAEGEEVTKTRTSPRSEGGGELPLAVLGKAPSGGNPQPFRLARVALRYPDYLVPMENCGWKPNGSSRPRTGGTGAGRTDPPTRLVCRRSKVHAKTTFRHTQDRPAPF